MANPARDFRNTAQAKWPGAVVVERTRNGIKHRHPTNPNRFMFDGDIGPLHIRGTDTEIDTAWTTPADPGVWQHEMLLSDYHAQAKNSFNGSPLVEFSVGSDFITLQPRQIDWTNDNNDIQLAANVQSVIGSVSDDVIHWADAYGTGIHFEWETQTVRLAKKIIIDNYTDLPAPSAQVLSGTNPVLRPGFQMDYGSLTCYVNGQAWTGGNRPDIDTDQPIEFRRDDNSVAFIFTQPHVYDADGNIATGIVHRVSKAGPNLLVEIRVPQAWLESAIYPVIIDPTVDEQVGASSDDADENSGGTVFLTTTYTEGPQTNVPYAGFRFTTVAIEGTIDVATMDIYVHANKDDPALDIYAEDTDSALTFTTGGNNISGRTLTTASVNWTDTNIGWSAFKTTPSIVSIIQEIVDRAGWSSGNDIAMIFVDDGTGGYIRIETYDSSSTLAAKLHVEYTAGGGGTDLTVADANVTTQIDAPTLTQVHNITVNDGSVITQADVPSLTQVHNLTVADAYVTSQSDNVILVQAQVLIVDNAFVTTQTDNVVLTQVHNISVNDTSVQPQSDNVVLVQLHNLQVDNSFVTTQMDAVVVTSGALTLVVANSSVDTQVDTFNLTQIHNISVNGTYVTTQADATVLVQAHLLSIDDASVTIQVDDITGMIQEHNINVGDVFVVTQADVLSLTQVHNLSVDDSYVTPVLDTFAISVLSEAAVIYWTLYNRDKNWDLENRDLGLDLFDRDSNWDLEDI